MLKNIDVKHLKNLIGTINIIDIRSVEKYNTSHIETSINIKADALLMNPNKYISKEKEYYIYCQYGRSSMRVCMTLSSLGYKVINILGGYESWLLN